ncbi:helix-turn-helix domain-containing protein [Streptomyces coeruleoprunus]|uniref:Helix-turn-helix domain-containing protein n=1 Tax=Streptomyces coeruleoprunus TaxID=285563 RepID=A0ABV9X9F3_9ACTN
MGGPVEGDVEAFAEHLRKLKDRTGLSYGALAQRLHVGRSTLHRYCLGETVPPDYALVERLARLARAERQELLDLHREWVLAEAARTRAAQAPVAEPEPEAAEAASPAPAEPEPSSAQDAAAPPEETPPRPEPSPEAEPLTPAHSENRPDRPGRLRWTLAAAAAAAVLTGAVVAVDLASGGGPGAPASPRAGAVPSAGGAPSAGTSTKDAPTPTPPSDSPSRTAPPSTGSGSSAPAVRPPLWNADSHVWANGCDHRYLVDRNPGSVPPPPLEQDARQWAGALGAVHAGSTIVRATVTAPPGGAVVVERLSVRVVARRAPLMWPVYAMSNGCGGMITPASYAVDLDAARPLARPVEGFDGERPLPVTRLPYRVSEGDPLVLRVEASAKRCDCDWYLEAEWSSGERHGTLRIDDRGNPFRTSGYGADREYGYAPESGGWSR